MEPLPPFSLSDSLVFSPVFSLSPSIYLLYLYLLLHRHVSAIARSSAFFLVDSFLSLFLPSSVFASSFFFFAFCFHLLSFPLLSVLLFFCCLLSFYFLSLRLRSGFSCFLFHFPHLLAVLIRLANSFPYGAFFPPFDAGRPSLFNQA